VIYIECGRVGCGILMTQFSPSSSSIATKFTYEKYWHVVSRVQQVNTSFILIKFYTRYRIWTHAVLQKLDRNISCLDSISQDEGYHFRLETRGENGSNLSRSYPLGSSSHYH
jgi:hypothetical protein